MHHAAERNSRLLVVRFRFFAVFFVARLLGFFVFLFVIVFLFGILVYVGGAAPNQAGRAGKGDDGGETKDGREQEIIAGMRRMQQHRRQAQYGVADDTAEAARQRPAAAARQTRSECGGEYRAKYPEQDAQAPARQRAMTEKPIAPNRKRQDQRQRA